MRIVPRFVHHASLIARAMALALVGLIAGATLADATEPRRIEIRGGETLEIPLQNGRAITLRFTKVISDGRTRAPVVEIQAVGTNGQNTVYRLSPAAHLAAPFVPVQGHFIAFGELASPPRELTTAGRPAQLADHLLKLTMTP